MIFQLTTKNCEVSDRSWKYINRNIEKIERMLPRINSDLVVLRFNIRKNIDRYFPPKIHPNAHARYSDEKTALGNFEGSITVRFQKNSLYARFKGITIDHCIDLGFKRFFKELKQYKDLHFSSESKYPNHSSIRGSMA